MKYNGNKVEGIKIAYVGGGSRGWAWGLMSDLASCEDISGDVYLYDIDFKAAQDNEIVGNLFRNAEGCKSIWNYHAAKDVSEAMSGADFVIISILPGTFDEMESDVHQPEKYGIYQSVGDTTGPGGIIRAMRTIPMYEKIAGYIKEYCPDAWVISYTNPMTLCVKTLYRVFPEIKAFGCCHEVFGTQYVISDAIDKVLGIKDVHKDDIKVKPVGINHFTWITDARYKNIDLMPVYEEFCNRYSQTGYTEKMDDNWMNNSFQSSQRVKMDLYKRYGSIAAAGDRHLAEFCNGKWYLASPEKVKEWGFGLTPVSWRKQDLKERLERSRKYISGEDQVTINNTGEDGVKQIRAILGLSELVTNVNLPNMGQISNLPIGAVVETNAVFRAGTVTPVISGAIPEPIYPLISRICYEQERVNAAVADRNLKEIFNIFSVNPLVTCSFEDSKQLFKEMVLNTKEYLTEYDLSHLEEI